MLSPGLHSTGRLAHAFYQRCPAGDRAAGPPSIWHVRQEAVIKPPAQQRWCTGPEQLFTLSSKRQVWYRLGFLSQSLLLVSLHIPWGSCFPSGEQNSPLLSQRSDPERVVTQTQVISGVHLVQRGGKEKRDSFPCSRASCGQTTP